MSSKISFLAIALYIVIVLLACTSEARPRANSSSSSSSSSSSTSGAGKLCEPDHLTVYRVIINTFWSESRFPKQFPQWRPPAQWSKVVGRSHDKSYVLFRLGQPASAGLKIFAEDGKSDALDAQSQGEGGVYDEFNAPPVTSGEGKTEAEFFVDGNHSRVSLISKMVPSPDWFIGIDNFDLCVNGKWMDGVTIEVDPLDAGTDSGFTFTAPNWPTVPQGVVYRLTKNYPNHPASSFYYPELRKLPVIATFQFIKVKEYELSEVFHHSEESAANEVLKMEHISYFYEDENGRYSPVKKPSVSTTPPPVPQVPARSTTTVHPPPTSSSHNIKIARTNTEEAIVKNIVETYRKQQKNHAVEHRHQQHKATKIPKNKKDIRKIRPPRDCQISEWAEWSPCSRSCDIGESTRTRKVLHHARRGGRPCPPLVEKKWCGSARSCNRKYFKW